ncbi:pirin family protein [Citrifermentans bemidjiense Bem]|uniref:Pirin family protein n=1 Tax=Citrifermentans bemidjiense (strain ATCC BAA-1014 / DSM 16622 / JCM 12645 / Bem) TaxID=404380 RepID=B5EGH7_CITBB|nr:pirin family protein [Citrifermentans bemidjiense]ACH38042.1 pirin family protein [Citrifermentans bemidjiense Bem]
MTESIRKIRKVWKSEPTIEGAGVHLKRAFGNYQVPMFDPFLLLDDFHSDDPAHYLKGFPWHPHRGIETITYVLQGRVEHGDSMGNKGVIEPGDLQWMTAGSGIIHQEMPKGDSDNRLWGFQLWANLPASHKMMTPRYQGILASEIPEVTMNGIKVKVICGHAGGVEGPVRDVIADPEYLDVTVPEQAIFTHTIKRGYTALAYVIDGEAYFDGERNAFGHDVVGVNYFDLERRCECGPENLILFSDGDLVSVTTQSKPVRFLLISGKPIGEPVAWYGPIVMNSQEELQLAFEELEKGTFVKKGSEKRDTL